MAKTKPDVKKSGRHLGPWWVNEIEPSLRQFATNSKVTIEARNPKGHTSAPITEDGKLFIRFYSTPTPTEQRQYEKVLGVILNPTQANGLAPTGSGIQLKDSNGLVFGEVHGSTLYILFDLPAGPAQHLLDRVMEIYLDTIQPTTPGEVTISRNSRSNCNHQDTFKKSLKEWLMEQKNHYAIELHFWENSPRHNVGDRKLHIYFQRREAQLSNSTKSSLHVGMSAEYVPGEKILVLFGELLGDGHCTESHELKIAKELISSFSEIAIESDPDKRNSMIQERMEREREQSRQAWVKMSIAGFEQRIKAAQGELKQSESRVRDLSSRLTEEVRLVSEKRTMIEVMTDSRARIETQFSNEFDKLVTLPHVQKVKATEDTIEVFTDRIFIEHRGQRYDIGDFRIEIYTKLGAVRMFNLTRQVRSYRQGDMHHPHVMPDGDPCLGNIKTAIPELIGDYQYSVVAILCIQYLESLNYDNDDAGKYIDRWPVAQPKEGETVNAATV